jgi:tetratricopeptide (TPR) repeat protein
VESALHWRRGGSFSSAQFFSTKNKLPRKVVMRTPKLLLVASLTVVSTLTLNAQQAPFDRLPVLEQSIHAGTATRDERIELARLYVQSGRFYEASKLAQSVLANNAGDADALAIRSDADARFKAAAGQKVASAEARASASGATDQDRLALADAYFEAGNYAAASEHYSRVPAAVQTRESRLRRARSLAWTSRLDEAEQIYADLLAEERTPDVELEYGRVLSWMGASRAAVQTLTGVYDRTHDEASAVALANARAWSGDREGAVALLRQHVASNPGASEARRVADEFAASPDLAIEQLRKRAELDPYNLAVQLDLARMQANAGRYAEARSTIRFIREHAPARIDGLDELQRSVEQRRQEELATLEGRRQSLDAQASMASSSQNADEILSLARAYNGLAAYDRSLPLYENYLALRPNDFDARVQYARVLSWDRQYGESERQYERLLRERPERADLRYEYATILSYDERFVPALRTFNAVTRLDDPRQQRLYSDVPPRAHYNIGQIYRWYGWNDTALAQQNLALAGDPGYNPALREVDLLQHRRPSSTLNARYTFATDSNDFTLRRVTLGGEKWVSNRTAFDLGVGRDWFSHRGQEVSANALNGGAAYRLSDRTTLRARAGANFYDRGLGTRPFFGAGATFRPSIQSRAALDFNHYDLVYDVFNFSALGSQNAPGGSLLGNPLTINDFRGHYDYATGGHWAWLADAAYGSISDSNKRTSLHGILSFELFHKPFVALKADGRWMSYDFRSSRYWSPTRYNSLAGVVQVGQDLRRFAWNAEYKVGRAHETGRSSDLRAWGANITVPVGDSFDIIGSYNYGRSGRFNSVLGGSGDDFVNYWQRNWFVGLRVNNLFGGRGERSRPNPYYFDNHALSSTAIPPEIHE